MLMLFLENTDGPLFKFHFTTKFRHIILMVAFLLLKVIFTQQKFVAQFLCARNLVTEEDTKIH